MIKCTLAFVFDRFGSQSGHRHEAGAHAMVASHRHTVRALCKVVQRGLAAPTYSCVFFGRWPEIVPEDFAIEDQANVEGSLRHEAFSPENHFHMKFEVAGVNGVG